MAYEPKENETVYTTPFLTKDESKILIMTTDRQIHCDSVVLDVEVMSYEDYKKTIRC